MEKVKEIKLIFENCDAVTLRPKDFKDLTMKGVSVEYNINCFHYTDGEVLEEFVCTHFEVFIKTSGLRKSTRFQKIDKLGETLGTHVHSYNDITHVILINEQGEDLSVRLPWTGGDYENDLQDIVFEDNSGIMIRVGNE